MHCIYQLVLPTPHESNPARAHCTCFGISLISYLPPNLSRAIFSRQIGAQFSSGKSSPDTFTPNCAYCALLGVSTFHWFLSARNMSPNFFGTDCPQVFNFPSCPNVRNTHGSVGNINMRAAARGRGRRVARALDGGNSRPCVGVAGAGADSGTQGRLAFAHDDAAASGLLLATGH
eukprot:COSAG02_NODE_1917_length_10388_cov_116.704733_4_plen_175_part_00